MNSNKREQKATQIFSEAKSIRKITKNQYSVDSQTSDKSYLVRKLQNADILEFENATVILSSKVSVLSQP